jgi:hypothetical protein
VVHDLLDRARDQQDDKYGTGAGNALVAGSSTERLRVLAEQLGDAARASSRADRGDGTTEAVHRELMQLAASAAAWVEADLAAEPGLAGPDAPERILPADPIV